MNEEIEKLYKDGNMKILEILNKDSLGQIKEMPYSIMLELKKIWLEKTGENLDDFQKTIDNKIKKIQYK